MNKRLNRTSGYYQPQLETMASRRRQKYQLTELQKLAAWAYKKSPAIKARFQEAGIKPQDIRSLKDLEKIPLLKKSTLPQLQQASLPFAQMVATPLNRLKRIYISPGPIYDPQGRGRRYWNFEKAFYAAGFREGDLVQVTFMYHMVPLGMMCDDSLVELGCVVIPAGVGNTEQQVKVMRELPVTGYVGTPSFLNTLLNKAEEMGLNLKKDLSLQTAWVIGEMLPETLRQEIESRTGMILCQGYGIADIGSIAYECYQKEGMHITEELILEIVDPTTGRQLGPGETGEVVITAFNRTYPLIRLAVGDLSLYTDKPCPCGRTSHRLLKIAGRVGEATKVRGMFIYPHQVDEVMKRFPEVPRYRVVITRRQHQDEMTFEIEVPPAGVNLESLKEKISTRAREIMKLRAEVQSVPGGTLSERDKKIEDKRSWE